MLTSCISYQFVFNIEFKYSSQHYSRGSLPDVPALPECKEECVLNSFKPAMAKDSPQFQWPQFHRQVHHTAPYGTSTGVGVCYWFNRGIHATLLDAGSSTTAPTVQGQATQ